jgi:outer membrane biosynthesis protein TonB
MRSAAVALVFVSSCTLGLAVHVKAQGPLPTAARLRAGASAPLAPQLTIGGGEVILDVAVATDGTVTKVQPVRTTPPYTELLARAVSGWSFDPARAIVEDALQPSEGHVLVLAVYRPPQVYAAPARGEETKTVGELSPELPVPGALSMPASYPPRATRDGAVVIELELTMAGVARSAKVISRPSAFDSAALDTVKGWRLGVPRQPSGAQQLFVYAVVGFREPITQ